jgi:hypothetical protein
MLTVRLRVSVLGPGHSYIVPFRAAKAYHWDHIEQSSPKTTLNMPGNRDLGYPLGNDVNSKPMLNKGDSVAGENCANGTVLFKSEASPFICDQVIDANFRRTTATTRRPEE